METYAFILGTTPELSIEELLHVVRPLGYIVEAHRSFLVFQGEIDCAALLPRLGGTVKIVRIFDTAKDWTLFTHESWLHALRSELSDVRGKFIYGASVYGGQREVRQHIKHQGLALKKHIKKLGISVRFVSNTEGILSSVAVKKNRLVGRELVILGGRQWYFGLTCAVQDFELYGARDYGRPSRNMQRGLLPPKVAQVMLNLAEVSRDTKLLDPFCGGGTVLQEAVFAGLRSVWGSDKDAAAVEEAKRNLGWLKERFNKDLPKISQVDALDLRRTYESDFFQAVVTEPYLGPSRLLGQRSLTRAKLQEVIAECGRLYKGFFGELRYIVAPRARAVVIFPMFRLFGHLEPAADLAGIERLGWKLEKPSVLEALPDAHLSSRGQLLYGRPDQVVLREITVWTRI